MAELFCHCSSALECILSRQRGSRNAPNNFIILLLQTLVQRELFLFSCGALGLDGFFTLATPLRLDWGATSRIFAMDRYSVLLLKLFDNEGVSLLRDHIFKALCFGLKLWLIGGCTCRAYHRRHGVASIEWCARTPKYIFLTVERLLKARLQLCWGIRITWKKSDAGATCFTITYVAIVQHQRINRFDLISGWLFSVIFGWRAIFIHFVQHSIQVLAVATRVKIHASCIFLDLLFVDQMFHIFACLVRWNICIFRILSHDWALLYYLGWRSLDHIAITPCWVVKIWKVKLINLHLGETTCTY